MKQRTVEEIQQEDARDPLADPQRGDVFAMYIADNEQRVEITANDDGKRVNYIIQRTDKSRGPVLQSIRLERWQDVAIRQHLQVVAKRRWDDVLLAYVIGDADLREVCDAA